MKKLLVLIFTAVFVVLAFLVSCGGSEESGGSGNSNTSSSGGIYGHVTDFATGEDVANANVQLRPSGETTLTGSDGMFEFRDLTSGDYSLTVSKAGYSNLIDDYVITVKDKMMRRDVQLKKESATLRIVDDKGNDIDELDFGYRLDDISRSFNIFNDSPSSINWEITKNVEWIKSVSKESGNLVAGDTLGIIVEINRSLLREGENLTQLHITSNNGNKQLAIKATKSDPCKDNPCGHGTCKMTDIDTYECKCDDGYTLEENKCVNERISKCEGVPENASWNTASKIEQTWDGKEWIPTTKGEFNEESSDTECRFICDTNYTWKGASCEPESKTTACTDLPENASWNTATSIIQTWNGTEWLPSAKGTFNEEESMSECHFKCNTNYTWKGSVCAADTRIAECEKLPAGAMWNTVSSITQTWNGEIWQPSLTAVYGETETTQECRFKCDTNHKWNGSSCERQVVCTGLPTNAQWNTAETITQTWNGSEWTPSAIGSYSETASSDECIFKCNTHYNYNSSTSTCDAAKQTVNCTEKPANTVWNTTSTVTQTWDGYDWTPSNTSTYSTTAGTCKYKCDDTHYWSDSECTNPCDYNPCEEVENSTKVCTATSWQDYSCGCTSGYYWWGTETGCSDKLTLGKICTGQTLCYNAEKVITCPTSSNDDFYGQDAQYTSKCTSQSFSSSSNVVIDNNTGLTWEKSPSEETYTWDEASDHCADLNSSNYGGISNWRVPNPFEFLTIVDSSNGFPGMNSNFTGMPTGVTIYFWTSKEYKGNTSYAYTFSTNYGFSGSCIDSDCNFGDLYFKTNTYQVLCVSGNELLPATLSDFTTSSGGKLVTDNRTGLIWQNEYATDKTWQQALQYCEKSTYAGYNDWRLPNRNELASLMTYEKSELPYSYFPDMPVGSFWSSSTLSHNDSHAFTTGDIISSSRKIVDTYTYVRCVRK